MLYVNPLDATCSSVLGPGAPKEGARERAAFGELEHFFLFTLLQEMRKTVPQDGLLDGESGQARQIFDEMLDDALSGEMARSGQFGIAKSMKEQLRIGEMQHALKRTPVM
ncbi:MAG: Rod-binding protein [Candidatus Hydrogenedentes bacterium]|nr:Rod-binding protein [Candidatus Hydrogenedentota bacterium]